MSIQVSKKYVKDEREHCESPASRCYLSLSIANYSDFPLDIAANLPDIVEETPETPTVSWGLNLEFLDEEPCEMGISHSPPPAPATSFLHNL